MRLLRFSTKDLSPRYGWEQNGLIGEIAGSPFEEFRRYEPQILLSKVKLLPPCEPTKIICVGRNYLEHAKESNSTVPEIPLLFLKPPSSLIGNGATIEIPPQSKNIEHEAELAVIIKSKCRWVSPENVKSVILGYTISNDVTARDLQRIDSQWTRGKGFDSFCPLGPWIETEFDSTDALLTCYVDNQLRQMSSTRDMVFPVNTIISFITSIMTLLPGDVILTGTPAGVGRLLPGNKITIQIEGIGTLENTVSSSKIAEKLL